MKSVITNIGKNEALLDYKNKIVKYALIGSSLETDETLMNLLNSNDPAILENLNIINKIPDNVLSNYIITDAKLIDASLIDNQKRLVFSVNLKETDIPVSKFVYAIALADVDGNVYTLASFAESFNSMIDASETITIVHALISEENMNENLKFVSDGEMFITRDEYLFFINNHNHDNNYIDQVNFKSEIARLDRDKANRTQVNELDLNTVKLTGEQTVRDIKTFNNLPESIETPTKGNQLTTKSYVDAKINEKLKSKFLEIDEGVDPNTVEAENGTIMLRVTTSNNI